MKSTLTLLTFLTLIGSLLAERVVILPFESSDWSYSLTLDEDNQQVDASVNDPDFSTTWLDQSYGTYFSPLNYNGPEFQANQASPFYAGNVPGITNGTLINLPAGANWQRGYFLKVIDGGETGYQNLQVRLLARDGVYGYLNGQFFSGTPMNGPPFSNATPQASSDGITIQNAFTVLSTILRPGPNLLAIYAARMPGETEDFGFKIEITGEAGSPLISGVTENMIDSRLHLRWTTKEPQKTIVELWNSISDKVETFEGDTSKRVHYFSRELPAGANVRYDILQPNGESWTSDTLATPLRTIFDHDADDWHYLQVRDGNDNDIDPAGLDPDFYETWYRQAPPGVTMPFESANYDGPAFTAGANAPFQYGAPDDFEVTGTELTPPNNTEGRTLWLYKIVDGGEFGATGMDFDLNLRGGYFLYLNGKFVAEGRMDGPDLWNTETDFFISGLSTDSVTWQLQNMILNPGPNLLALSIHGSQNEPTSFAFSSSLTSSDRRPPTVRDFQEESEGTAFKLSYLTGTAQQTVVLFGPSKTELTEIIIPGERVLHRFERSDLIANTDYFYEVRNGGGTPFTPPITGHFRTGMIEYLSTNSSDWQVLHSLDNEGLGMNPALADPDFDDTWMTKGLEDSLYDGPTFVPDQTAPFHMAEVDIGAGATTLPLPGDNRSGAIYFIKEIEGPPTGASEFNFDISSSRIARCYLNGNLIIDEMPNLKNSDSWETYGRNRTGERFVEQAFLLPGKNVLAISLHPNDENYFHLRFDMRAEGRPGLPEMAPARRISFQTDSAVVAWFGNDPSPARLRYGSSRDSLTETIEMAETTRHHKIAIPRGRPGERTYYELLRPDGSSYDPPAVNSFISPKNQLIDFGETWHYLDFRDPETNQSSDPQRADPDFYETWTTQSLGSYPGIETYDGPIFQGPARAPFGTAAPGVVTELLAPGASWYLKEIDGGDFGYQDLEIFINNSVSLTIFLNGQIVGQSYTHVANQAIWSQGKGNEKSGAKIAIAENLTIPPGPNLIAVLAHRIDQSNRNTFDLSVQATPIAPGTTSVPRPLEISPHTVTLTWNSGDPRQTRMRWGLSPAQLTEVESNATPTRAHTVLLDDLKEATTYFVETLESDGTSFTPPRLTSFTTPSLTILERQSSGWALFESIKEGQFADPTATDPDFISTWFKQALGNYPGDGTYDGPTFTKNLTSPFVSEGLTLRVEDHQIQTIETEVRPVWLLKEIHGGESGFQSLILEGIQYGGIVVYLNGQKLFSRIMGSGDTFSDWDRLATWNNESKNFSITLPSVIKLNPGANLLAISLHPFRFQPNGYLGAEFEIRGIPQSRQIIQPAVNFSWGSLWDPILSWTTSSPSTAVIRYGTNALQLDQTLESSTLRTAHQITLADLEGGQPYTFEIASTDAEGESTIAAGSFETVPRIPRQPYLQRVCPDSATVKWRTFSPMTTRVYYGEDPDHLDQFVDPQSERPFVLTYFGEHTLRDHTAVITGLSPATRYYYQVELDDSAEAVTSLDRERYFDTAPLSGESASTRIWVIGDSGLPGPGVQSVKDAYLQWANGAKPDVWLMLGDNAYNSGTDIEYQRGFFDIFPELLKNTPVWPTMGNHDAFSQSKAYYQIFDLPTQGECGGYPSGTEKYYSFDRGKIHFVCLNSEEYPDGMNEWLVNDLSSTRADWIIAYLHHGPYTKGSHDSDYEREHLAVRDKLLPILENFGVDLILSGHSHAYERSHLIDGHYGRSWEFQAEQHSLDPRPGSQSGKMDRLTGQFIYQPGGSPYKKAIATSRSGEIAATVGASSKLTGWSDAGAGQLDITHPNPHPVHVSTLRELGSMVIDIDGTKLRAFYLDGNGQVRDEFEIHKHLDDGPSIAWWRNQFNTGAYPYFADWSDDPDGDQSDNLSEYVLGGDPLTKDQLFETSIVTDGLHNGSPAQYFTIRYRLREGAKATVLYSHDLESFDFREIENRQLSLPGAEGFTTWEARILKNNRKRVFFKIQMAR